MHDTVQVQLVLTHLVLISMIQVQLVLTRCCRCRRRRHRLLLLVLFLVVPVGSVEAGAKAGPEAGLLGQPLLDLAPVHPVLERCLSLNGSWILVDCLPPNTHTSLLL